MLGDKFATSLAGARLGAEWAWSALYRDLAPPVLAYVRARGASEPEEVCGDVFLQVVRDLRRFDGGEREFRAWVFVIAHHRLLDEQRGRRRRQVAYAAELPQETTDAEGVEDEALRSLSVERIDQIIRQLSPDQRDVLLLRVLGGLTVPEVARVVKKRSGAINALQRRGLAAIERAMRSEGVTL